jgi:ABC-type phosphate transport system auxiliary subunit
MAITTRLSRKLHQTLGDEAAEDLVTWMQQVDAQRAELRELNELNFSRFDARLAEAREAMRADLAELRQEIQAGFAKWDGELRQGLARVETKLEQRTADLIKWSFVFWVGAVGAIAALAGVLR